MTLIGASARPLALATEMAVAIGSLSDRPTVARCPLPVAGVVSPGREFSGDWSLATGNLNTSAGTGIAATPTSAAVATRCFMAAEAWGITMSSRRAMARISVAFRTIHSIPSAAFADCSRAASSNSVVISASFLACLVDQIGQTVQFLVGQLALLPLDQRSHDGLGRAVEKRGQELVQRGEAHL